MSRAEFIFLLVLIILSASIGLALAHDQSGFVRFELCADRDDHPRDRQVIFIRKRGIAAIQEASQRGCVLIGSPGGQRVHVYAPDPNRPVASTKELLESGDQ